MSRWQYSCEHTGPGTLAGRYMRQFWQPVHVLDKIPPGQAVPLRIMGEDFTLYRGASGTPYLVDSRCAHRGVQLSVGRVDGEEITCLYHGWRYTGQGQCVEQPGELDQQFSSRVKIRGYPTRDYHGLVFAYLGDADAPEFPIFQVLEGDGIIDARGYRRACNLTNFLDNQLDEVHVAFTHPEGFARIPEIPRVGSFAPSSPRFLTVPGRAVSIAYQNFSCPISSDLSRRRPMEGCSGATLFPGACRLTIRRRCHS